MNQEQIPTPSSRPPTLTGHVAKVVNTREVAITVGADRGARVGMVFSIHEEPTRIVDPVTRNHLGELSREKVKVKVFQTFDKFSVARTFETYTVRTGGLVMGNLDLLTPGKVTTHVRTLRAEEHDAIETLSDQDSYVKVGDPVQLVAYDEPVSKLLPKSGVSTIVKTEAE